MRPSKKTSSCICALSLGGVPLIIAELCSQSRRQVGKLDSELLVAQDCFVRSINKQDGGYSRFEAGLARDAQHSKFVSGSCWIAKADDEDERDKKRQKPDRRSCCPGQSVYGKRNTAYG